MNELIIIAKALEQIANELAEIKYILKYRDNESRYDRTEPYHETQHGPTETRTDPCTTHGHTYNETVTYGDFKRRMTE